MTKRHHWTEEQKGFIKALYPKHSRKELLEVFNKEFELNITMGQLEGCLSNNGYKSGRSGRFQKGCIPFNKGMKGVTMGGVQTQFKKGNRPHNYRPVGSERVEKDGYILVKVSDTGKWSEQWKPKQRVVWEAANGPIPDGHCLIFLDRNKHNVSLGNLQMISKAQLARLNYNDLISDDPSITETGILIAGIYTEIGKRRSERDA